MTPPLTDAELEEIDRVYGAATPGPWATNDMTDTGEPRVESKNEHGEVNDGWALATLLGPDARANAVAMARARTDVPRLVEEVRRLRAKIEEMESERRNL